MLERHRATAAAATLATSVIDDPTGYGRIVRDGSGRFERIVEHKNATEAQRAIREVNPSYYVFDAAALFGALAQVTPDAASGELYITDVFEILLGRGQRVEVIDAVPPQDILSINTPEQLAEVDRIFRSRRVPAGAPVGDRQ
jgi:bifunctional UDP-N-acetylglucosamine pyrophosphorylase/glucosamine-1-phosphate N-acetyltransferase